MTSMVDRLMTRFLTVRDTLYRRTGGRIGHRLPFAPPALLLHTVGAKTGQPRANSLAHYRDGADYVIVASNGGARRSPGWYHNLRANPHVQINLGPRRIAVTAHALLPDDPDYARLWKICDDKNAGRYSAYQELTTRPIPVVRLTP